MTDSYLREIRHSVDQATGGNWRKAHFPEEEVYKITTVSAEINLSEVGIIKSPADAHLVANSKDYIRYLLRLLEKE